MNRAVGGRDIGQWLTGIGLGRYENDFAANGIDFDVLFDLTDDDLRELGFSLGDRKRLLKATAALRAEESLVESATDGQALPLAPIDEEGARRQVTVLFADLVGYTKLGREIDAEDVHALLGRLFEHVDGIVTDHGGSIDKHIGDCVMAVFGAPISYGNDTERAVRAALAIRSTMPDLSGRAGRDLSIHIGIASGQVVASGTGSTGHREYTVTGETVTLASRLTDAARSGEILLSEEVQRALSARLEVEDVGEMVVKGLDQPVRAWRLRGLRTARSQRQRLAGRTGELQQFRAALTTCRETGRGQAVYVRGDAGVGKTRLIEEVESLGRAAGFACHTGLVLDFGTGTGRDAIRALLGDLLGVGMSSDREAARRAAAAALDQGLVTEDDAMFLNDLLDLPQPPELHPLYDAMDNTLRNQGKRRALAGLVERASQSQPRLLVVEDLHWAEDLILADLAELAATAATCPVLLVMTSRLEGDPLDHAWRARISPAPLITIDLAPLREEDARAMAGRFCDADAAFVERCIERAAGNPLFLEQLLRHAEDDRVGVPSSVQSLVQARLDRLPAEDRAALQAASVLGQRFGHEPLRCLLDGTDYAPERLVGHGLVRPQGDGLLFAHALIRDAVYDGLLRRRRRELHRKAARWFATTGDLVLRAEHLDRAEDDEAAGAYLAAAQAQANEYRYETALQLLRRGLELAPNRKIRLALTQRTGDMLRELGSTAASIEAFDQALALAEREADRCRAWIGLVAGMRVADRIDEALALLDTAEPVALAHGLDAELSQIHYYRGSLYFPRGNIDGCIEQHGRALHFAKLAGLPEQEALALSGLGDGYYAKGRMRTAHEYFQRCLALCDEHGLGRVEAANRFMIATVRIYLNELEGALKNALASAELALRVGHQRAEIVSRLTAGWILIDQGAFERAREQIERGLEAARAVGARRFEPFLAESIARIRLAQGDREGAAALLESALEDTRALGALTFIGPWVLGSLARATDDAQQRREALAEGSELLAGHCVGHNYYNFYRHAIEASLASGDWDGADTYAAALEAYTAPEPVPWSAFFVARGQSLAEYGRGRRDSALLAALERLRLEAERVGFRTAMAGFPSA